MSQFDKLLYRIHLLDNNMRFDELKKVIAVEREVENEQNS